MIRYEEGKEAEIFTLVIRGTNEEHWYNTSSAGKSYIELNEEELLSILTGEELPKQEKKAEESALMFRL